ncbi:tetratricopeptide repeat protein [Streptosporangium vulgare]|uniref:Tetratricopeptide repeat protein n=1 Tax=Streptosporangium vulgare TaxID=46190 RepID=A0ABV5TRL7_9ACTN
MSSNPRGGYSGDHVELHGAFHDKVFGKVDAYIEHYHPPADHQERPQIVEGDIPRQPPGFQPRAELVKYLAEQVAARGAAVVCALTGTPGVGKSVLAASYAWACQAARWPVVAWIAAESQEQILTGLAALAERLGVRGADDDAHTAASRAKNWLAAADQRCLVVFDNAADPELVRRWCPATGAARVVITSRNAAFSRIYAPVEVAAFTPAEARRLLAERTGRTGEADQGDADRVADELGRLPLAVSQAAAVIAQRRIPYADYLRLLQDFPLADYLPAQAGEGYPAGAAQAMLLAVHQAETTIEEAGSLLGVLAVLSPAGIPRYLLYPNPTPAPDTDSQADLAGRARVDGVLAELADTSLITFTADGSTIVMHRLVQRVLCERAHHDDQFSALIDHATTVLAALNDTIPDEEATWSARSAVETLHEQTTALHTHAPHSAELLTLRSWCGTYLYHLADLPRAIEVLTHVLTDHEKVLGADHPDTLLSRSNLAGAYGSAGRVAEAITMYKATLAEQERVLGADHPDTLASRSNLASTYWLAGRVAEAITMHEATLAERERVLGADHPDTLASRNDLAGAYGLAGRVAEAITMYEATLAERERVLGADHPHTLTSRSNLANAYGSAGRVAEAITMYEATLAEQERVLGADHPDTLASRSNLAGAYGSAGRVAEAITMHEATLAEQERVLGADHPDTLASRSNLAGAYGSVGRVAEAITMHEATLAERERVLGADHPDTLASRNDLAGAYGSVGRVAEAITMHEATLAERERVLGADHPHTLTSRSNLANAYGSVGRVAEAITMYEATLADCERVLGADHPRTRTVRDNYAVARTAKSSRSS